LSYGLKGVLASMGTRLARLLLSYGVIMNFRKQLCHLGPDNPKDIKNDEQYEMYPTLYHFARKQG
jgi:hypothetical protein